MQPDRWSDTGKYNLPPSLPPAPLHPLWRLLKRSMPLFLSHLPALPACCILHWYPQRSRQSSACDIRHVSWQTVPRKPPPDSSRWFPDIWPHLYQTLSHPIPSHFLPITVQSHQRSLPCQFPYYHSVDRLPPLLQCSRLWQYSPLLRWSVFLSLLSHSAL